MHSHKAKRLDGLPIDCQHITVCVPEGHDPALPIPLRIHVDHENPNCFATADGRRVFVDLGWAAKSMLMDTDAYKERTRRRMVASRLINAEVVAGFKGYVTCTGDEDDYFDSVDSLIERYSELVESSVSGEEPSATEIQQALPSWAFCTTQQTFDFNIESALECYLSDNHHESAHDLIKDKDWLIQFWKFWSSKQSGISTFFMDTSRIVVIDPDRFAKEREEAEAFLAEIAA
ncbi:hypothetical protein M8994_17405 [Brucella sp. 21LCYQ03]|nr:hypothetical protein [Brucella sp. 21LCYQ03]